MDMTRVYNMDCMEAMHEFPDKHFELAIVDPPYGIGEGQKRASQRARATEKWAGARPPEYGGGQWDEEQPSNEYFHQLKRVSKNQILWGANHFGNQNSSSGWIVWYKKRFNEINDFSDCELAYTSFAVGCRLFHFPWLGFGAVNAKEDRIHPTQKPVALYKWLLKNYAKECDKILDTHLGSGSSRIAAFDLGFDFTGYELDKDYFAAQEKRFKNHKAQLKLFAASR